MDLFKKLNKNVDDILRRSQHKEDRGFQEMMISALALFENATKEDITKLMEDFIFQSYEEIYKDLPDRQFETTEELTKYYDFGMKKLPKDGRDAIINNVVKRLKEKGII